MGEENKGASGKKRGVKFGGLVGGAGVVVLGGALVAATVWSICEFRRRKSSGKKGTSKDLQTPNSEQVKNVDGGGDELRLILQKSKLPVCIETEEKDVSDTSALKLLLDVEKILEFGINEEEKIREGKEIDHDGCSNESMVLIQKEDRVSCESIHEMTQEAVEVCHESLDADALSSVSEDDLAVSGDELGSGSQLEDSQLMEDVEVKIDRDFEACEKVLKAEEKRKVVQFATPERLADDVFKCGKNWDELTANGNCAIDDDYNDVVSEDLEYEGKDGSEASSGGMTDSSAESNIEVWPVESLEEQSEDIKNERNLNEIVEVDNNEELSAGNSDDHCIAYRIHQKESFDDNVSIYNKGLGSTTKGQMVRYSTRLKTWVSSVLLALLVLLVLLALLDALLAQQKYLSAALTSSISSISTFLMK